MVNNIDDSCRGRGLNWVVIDREGYVIDCCNVDTYGDPSLKIRRAIPNINI